MFIPNPNPHYPHHYLHPKTPKLILFISCTLLLSFTNASSSTTTSACATTLYPLACQTALNSSPSNKTNPFSLSLQFAIKNVKAVRSLAYNTSSLSGQQSSSGHKSTAVSDCLELLDATLEHLNDVSSSSPTHQDIKTWLSSSLTYQTTCIDILNSMKKSDSREHLIAQVENLSQYISNTLALYKHSKSSDNNVSHGRRLTRGLPRWLTAEDHELLRARAEDVKADAVVAKDGSGTHGSLREALEFVASLAKGSGGGRSVIYVKAGRYKESINVPTKQKNVMLMGDGKGKSVIVGSKSAGSGYTTYSSATVAAMGAGFIAKDITIINDAGPDRQQAVALRVGADKSVIFRCSLQGYQDTLYTLSNRQFYSETDIYGTIDFIFGNSAIILQNCFIQPRKPGHGQWNSITAQGRTDPNQNTGICIHKCTIKGSSDLGGTKTYLGRPWKKYARVVVMESYLDGSISGAGWERWEGNFALSTLYFGEYRNSGAGASTSRRVQWSGIRAAMSAAEALKFTVGNFIGGDSWLPGTGVSYSDGL